MSQTAIPQKYRNTIWDTEIITPEEGAFVLAEPEKPVEDSEDDIIWEMSGTILSYTTDTVEHMMPIIFPAALNAELYRQFIINQTPDHPVRNYEVRFMKKLPTKSGCFMSQKFGTCPACGGIAQYGNLETNEFFCETCGKPFDASPNPPKGK